MLINVKYRPFLAIIEVSTRKIPHLVMALATRWQGMVIFGIMI